MPVPPHFGMTRWTRGLSRLSAGTEGRLRLRRPWGEPNLELVESADDVVVAVGRFGGGQLHVGEPAEHGREGDLAFQAGQRRAQAEVGAAAECEVAVRGAADVEAVGVGELLGVAVG